MPTSPKLSQDLAQHCITRLETVGELRPSAAIPNCLETAPEPPAPLCPLYPRKNLAAPGYLKVLSGEETKARKGKVSSSPYQLSGNSGVKPGALGPMSLGSPLNSGVGLHPPDARLALLLNAPRR